ncbi:MAG: hypothetical protein IPM04_16135 [Saprospiraceae bacterium]|nr:hypothetical protein [Candidatus Brachybacter algidus]MBK8749284.1 hypothetical protein [Candidatus Brachybacter algidus]
MQATAIKPAKKQKTAAINTAPTHKAIIYAASAFGFLSALLMQLLSFFPFSLK